MNGRFRISIPIVISAVPNEYADCPQVPQAICPASGNPEILQNNRATFHRVANEHINPYPTIPSAGSHSQSRRRSPPGALNLALRFRSPLNHHHEMRSHGGDRRYRREHRRENDSHGSDGYRDFNKRVTLLVLDNDPPDVALVN